VRECKTHGGDYLLGLARSARRVSMIKTERGLAVEESLETGRAARHFREAPSTVMDLRYFQGLGLQSNRLDQIARSAAPYGPGYTWQDRHKKWGISHFVMNGPFLSLEPFRGLVHGKLSGY